MALLFSLVIFYNIFKGMKHKIVIYLLFLDGHCHFRLRNNRYFLYYVSQYKDYVLLLTSYVSIQNRYEEYISLNRVSTFLTLPSLLNS